MENILAENLHGTGGIKDKKDKRDYQFSQIANASQPFDWSVGFDVETMVGKLPVKNQYGSFSCGGQAWATYSYVLDQTARQEKSAKFIYAQTHIGSGGSDGRTNSQLCVKKGVSSEALCSSYLPDGTTSEAFITSQGDITVQAYADATTNEEKSYLAVNIDIDSIAQAIRDCNGVVIGIDGINNGTWRTAFPQPPIKEDNTVWRHWVFCSGAMAISKLEYDAVKSGIITMQDLKQKYAKGNS